MLSLYPHTKQIYVHDKKITSNLNALQKIIRFVFWYAEADESHFTEKRVRNGDKEIIIRKKLPPNFEQLHEDPVKSTKSITQIVKTYHNVSLVFSGLQYAIYIPHKFLAYSEL